MYVYKAIMGQKLNLTEFPYGLAICPTLPGFYIGVNLKIIQPCSEIPKYVRCKVNQQLHKTIVESRHRKTALQANG